MTSHKDSSDEKRVRSEKAALRRNMALAIKQLSPEQREDEGTRIVDALAESTLLPSGGRALLFAADETEPLLLPLGIGWGGEWSICLPRVEGESLGIFAVNGPQDLEPGAYGLFEPVPTNCSPVDVSELDLVILPGRGFTKEGARLGRGGGFYDRLLADLPPEVPRVGCCFSCQLVDAIPCEDHDMRVGSVCLPSGLIAC